MALVTLHRPNKTFARRIAPGEAYTATMILHAAAIPRDWRRSTRRPTKSLRAPRSGFAKKSRIALMPLTFAKKKATEATSFWRTSRSMAGRAGHIIPTAMVLSIITGYTWRRNVNTCASEGCAINSRGSSIITATRSESRSGVPLGARRSLAPCRVGATSSVRKPIAAS